jgi:protein transport protein SEC24
MYGAYEFKASSDYIARKPNLPHYVFAIDVSLSSINSGFFYQVVQSIKMTLDYFQNPSQTSLCFLTYDVNIHFYNMPQDPNGEPNILWVGDINDPFVPYPKEKLMMNVVDDRMKIDIFLDKLVMMHNAE